MKKLLRSFMFLLALVAVLSLVTACDKSDESKGISGKDTADEKFAYYNINYENVEQATHSNPDGAWENEEKFELQAPTSSAWYSFAGWYTDASFTDKCESITPSELSASITLYAKWDTVNFTVSFYAQDVLIHSEEFNIDKQAPTIPEIPPREGYTAIWQEFSLSPENITVTATYTPIPYTIVYENLLNGTLESAATYTTDQQTLLGKPERVGYTFLGWTYDGQTTPTPDATIEPGAVGTKTFWANWKANTYLLTFDAAGGSVAAPTLEVTYDKTFALPTPEWAGHTFVGWYNDNKILSDGTWDRTEGLTLVAKWDTIPYTIDYVMNGGANPTSNPTVYTAEDQFTLAEPQRTGYTFLGWTYAGQTEPVKEVTVMPGTLGEITFEANWKANTYTVTFDAAGGNVTAPTLEVTYDKTFTLPTPEWAGHTFVGWYHDNKILSDGTWDRTEGLDLVARWDAIPYTIDYVMNGGANPTTNPTVYTAEDAFTLTEPQRTGYIFLGWTYDGQTTPVKTVSFSVGTVGNKQYVANWEARKYTVTLDAAGGNVSLPTVDTTYDKSFTLPTPEWEGHEFICWLEDGKPVSEDVYTYTENKTFVASWKAITYAIRYVTNGGSDPAQNPTQYTYHDRITLVDSVQKGYTFLGWFDESGKKIADIPFGSIGDVTLIARWEVTVYTVTYKNTGGADLSGLVTEYTMFDDSIALPAISFEGYTFNGWLLDGKKVTEIPTGTCGDLVITADITPWAYQLKLETSYGEVSESTQTVYYGNAYTLPVPSATEGKEFLGWYENVSDSAVAYTDAEGKSVIPYHKTTSRVLYARFAATQCTVTYDTDGGNEIAPTVVSWGTAFDDSIIPTKEGAVFGGWYNTGLSTKYTSSYIIHSDMTVKAKWITATPISTAAEFKAIISAPSGKYYLTNDINLNGEVWATVGTFSGFLDGNGYSVKNFSISKTSVSTSLGFFCNNSGTIQNLVFEDFTFNVTATQDSDVYIGVFVGSNTGKIYNCVLKSGSVKISYTRTSYGYISAGGFAGANSGTISGCKNLINVNTTQQGHYTYGGGMWSEELYSYSRFGGLVGYNTGRIENSAVEATLSYTGSCSGFRKNQLRVYNYVGGLVGQNYTGGRVTDCYANVTVTASNSNIYPSNDDHKDYSRSHLRLGGLVGANKGTISGSYSLGTLKGSTPNDSNIGGLVGVHYDNGNINNCYSRSNVKGTTHSTIGGFVGHNEATVQNSFASGLVEGYGYVGGFLGYNSTSGTVSKCYSTASVIASNGNAGFFTGAQVGVALKCYYMRGSILSVGGSYKYHTTEHGSIQSVERDVLWSDVFLKETLYWDDEGWIILHSEDPMLEWEIAVTHDYELIAVEAGCETVGYTVYSCKHCNRFFVRDIVAPHGHEKTNFITVPPTCTAQGYNSYYCRVCECSVTEDVVEPLGHTKSLLVSHKDASCTEDGYDIYECHACNVADGVLYVIPALGHTEEHIDAVPATCQKAGKTEEIFCSVCGDVIKESKTIPPHDLVITIEKEADCLTDGLCSKACRNCDYAQESVVIPAAGHIDINTDYRCDSCGELSGKYSEDDVIEISTISDLKAIIKNMNGVYRLTADIKLPADWTYIGSEQKPFTGYFDGNGHTITFTENYNATSLGLFAYNEGIVTSLNIVGCNVGVTNESGTYGFVAVKNAGYITNCRLSGNILIDATAALRLEEYTTILNHTHIVFGGIAGINTANGTVNGCTVDAKITVHTANVAECLAKWSLIDLIRKGSYKNTSITSMLTVTVGTVVGENQGEIKGCAISTVVSCNETVPKASVENYYGYAEATTNLICGEIAGTLYGTVSDCDFSGEIRFTEYTDDFHSSKDGLLFGYRVSHTRQLVSKYT